MSVVAESSTPTPTLDPSAQLQQHTREFAALYESHVYLVYNIALRVTCQPSAAIESTQQAFLTLASEPAADEARVASVAAKVATERAPAVPEPHGAGDEESERMLAASVGLAASERAALALDTLAEADLDKTADALGLTGAAARRLRERALERLAFALRTPAQDAEAAYGEWLWAQPPDEMWQALYPRFYAAVERNLKRSKRNAPDEGATAAVPVIAAEPTGLLAVWRERRATRRAARTLGAAPTRPWWRRRWLALSLAAATLVAAALLAIDPFGAARQHDSLPATTSNGLTQAQIDQLRLQELARARGYAATHPSQPPVKRSGGAAKPGANALQPGGQSSPVPGAPLTRAQRAAQRRQAKALAKARKNQSLLTPATPLAQPAPASPVNPAKPRRRPQPPASTTPPPGSGSGTAPASPSPGSSPPADPAKPQSKPQADSSCLYDPDNGTYVCPAQ